MYKSRLLIFKKGFLILFIFSLPFEYWDPFGVASFLSVTKIAGFGYAGLALLNGWDSFDLTLDRYIKPLFIFWIYLVVISLFNYTAVNTESVLNFTLLQNIILYGLIASDLKKGNIKTKTLILAFILSITLMSILLGAGIGVGYDFEENTTRLTFFNNNPNTVGVLAGLAIVFTLYLLLNIKDTFGRYTLLLLLVLPGFLNLLLLSASRGALFTTGIAVLIMLILSKAAPFKRIFQIALLVLASSYFLDKLMESELMYNRLTQFIDEGNTAGRGEIWDNVIEIASHRPVLGYGTTGFETEMTKIYGGNKDAHNLFLYVMVTTGLIGFSIFMYFLILHLIILINELRNGQVLKLVLFVFYVTTVFKAGGVINNKLMWFLLAIILAAHFSNSRNKTVVL